MYKILYRLYACRNCIQQALGQEDPVSHPKHDGRLALVSTFFLPLIVVHTGME